MTDAPRHGPARPRAVRRDRGYSLIEVLVVIAVTTVGFLALISLQTSILRANENAWNTTGAVALARHIHETIRLEALQWYNDSNDGLGGVAQDRFRYLKALKGVMVGPGQDTGWLDVGRDAMGVTGDFQQVNQIGFQPAYDAGALQEVRNDRSQRFCVRYRLTWVVPNYLLRADVRVLWPRTEPVGAVRTVGDSRNYDACPMDGGTVDVPDGMMVALQDVNSLVIPATVMRNVFVAP
jgi:prepilin-type N-terminal cleavage/methylation domain-containing protein